MVCCHLLENKNVFFQNSLALGRIAYKHLWFSLLLGITRLNLSTYLSDTLYVDIYFYELIFIIPKKLINDFAEKFNLPKVTAFLLSDFMFY